MTDKERLEEIKNSYLEGIHRLFGSSWVSMPKENCDWLIQQAERVEELELEVSDWRAEVQKWQKFYKESEESHSETKELLYSTISENKRYKQALEFYAHKKNYDIKHLSEDEHEIPVFKDYGEKARKALESDEN
jgi:hypothetical protein